MSVQELTRRCLGTGATGAGELSELRRRAVQAGFAEQVRPWAIFWCERPLDKDRGLAIFTPSQNCTPDAARGSQQRLATDCTYETSTSELG